MHIILASRKCFIFGYILFIISLLRKCAYMKDVEELKLLFKKLVTEYIS